MSRERNDKQVETKTKGIGPCTLLLPWPLDLEEDHSILLALLSWYSPEGEVGWSDGPEATPAPAPTPNPPSYRRCAGNPDVLKCPTEEFRDAGQTEDYQGWEFGSLGWRNCRVRGGGQHDEAWRWMTECCPNEQTDGPPELRQLQLKA